MWIVTANFETEGINWIIDGGYSDLPNSQLYIVSWYFTVTTITTVGYGDITATSSEERLFCICLMIIGVIGFSVSTGTLSSILHNYDTSMARLKEKIILLDKMRRKYKIPSELYNAMRKSITYDSRKDTADVNEFMDSLQPNLKLELSLIIHKEMYTNIRFFKDREDDVNFIAWVCPRLRP